MKETMKRLPGSLAAKVTAFILVVVMACVTAGSVVGAMLIWEQDLYTQSKESYKQAAFEDMAYSMQRFLAEKAIAGDTEGLKDSCKVLGLLGVRVSAGKDNQLGDAVVFAPVWTYWETVAYDQPLFERTFSTHELHTAAAALDSGEEVDVYKVALYGSDSFLRQGKFGIANTLIDWAYALRYSIYAIGVTALLLTVVCFVFLMCSAGHRNGCEGLRTSFVTRTPFDLLTAACVLAGFLCVEFALEVSTYWTVEWLRLASYAATGLALVVLAVAWCYDAAVRVKLGRWWRNTVIYKVLRLLWRGARAVGRGAAALFRSLPLIWKTAVVLLGLSFAEFFGLVVFAWDMGALVLFWFLEKLVVVPAVLCLALALRKLERGGQALAAGDLSYQVDTRKLIWNFKGHGENLNSIAVGMTAAVEERLKSERMKTELITNVSHDIKTPLTSIINYADLIGREPTDNGKITEYAAVLHRQSERLKKLIEDLVDASKASTGNLEVLLAPCEAEVLVTQTAGEYQQRLEGAGLELVTRRPERTCRIMADGRRLWRVFDNLMNNVCKYAMPGTRVYLTLEERAGRVLISLKNTSREPLNLTAEEFMARFVRGDASRSTEGSGLGLSIAQSLTELQGGTFSLVVDGDLFKVTLEFPKLD